MSSIDLNRKMKLVYDVIQLNPGVQNNDADLVAAVWRHEGWDDRLSLENNIARVTRSETITRRRRQLHETGLITYSKDALGTRKEAFTNERHAHSELPRFF